MSPVGLRLLRRVSFCTLHRSATCPNAGSGLGPPGKGQENHRSLVLLLCPLPSLPITEATPALTLRFIVRENENLTLFSWVLLLTAE